MRFLLGLAVVAAVLMGASLTGAWASLGDPREPLRLDAFGRFRIAPNSDFIVFDAREEPGSPRALYAAPMAGGDAVRLSIPTAASNDATDSWVTVNDTKITPDGEHVVYSAFTPATAPSWGLYVVPVGGGTSTLLHATDTQQFFQVSPDGRTVAYISGGQLQAAPLAGGTPIDLDVQAGPGHAVGLVMSPDSASVVTYLTEFGDPGTFVAVPLDGSPRRALGSPPESFVRPSELRFSPDGRYLVYPSTDYSGPGATERLYSTPFAGGPAVRLNGLLPVRGDVKEFVVTPDSSMVVYRADQRVNNVNELWSVPIGGGASVRLNRKLPEGGDVKKGFVVAPDSGTVVYRADQRQDRRRELFAVDLAGGSRRRLNHKLPLRGDVEGFVLSPDGSTVVFRADQRTNNLKELFATPIEGGPLSKLNGPLVAGGDVKPVKAAWRGGNGFLVSPDSTKVLYIADQDVDNLREAYLVPVTGGATTKLSGPLRKGFDVECGRELRDISPCLWFSPDSQWAGFTADKFNTHGQAWRASTG